MSQRIIGGAFLAVIGILLITNPYGVWKVAEKWKMLESADMSPLFRYVTRAVGWVCAVIGALAVIGILR